MRRVTGNSSDTKRDWRTRRFRRAVMFGAVGFPLVILSAALIAAAHRSETLTAAPVKGRSSTHEPPANVIPLRIPVGPPAAELDVWVYEPEAGTVRTVVPTVLVLHGYSDSKVTMQALGPRFASRGARVVLVDLRGHGASSGDRISFGVFEAEDLLQVLDALERRGLARPPVAVYGPSYGGLIAIQLAGIDDRVDRVVVSGTMTSLLAHEKKRLRDELGALGKYVPDPLLDFVNVSAAALAGFDARRASAVMAASRAKARIVLVHGERDELVPVTRAQALVDRCGTRCELLVLPGMSHHDSLSNQPLRDRMNELFSDTAPEPHDAITRGDVGGRGGDEAFEMLD